jgi:Spy/CpxP family protein refolding chaperone
MKKTLTVLLLTLVCAVPAFADMQGKGMKEHGQARAKCECGEHGMKGCDLHKRDMLGMLIRHADKLGLKSDQVAKLKTIHTGMQKKMVALDADKKIARLEMKEILEVKDFDLDKANAQVQKISDIEKNKHLEMLKSMKEVRSILTDDQFKKLQEMKHRMWEGKGKYGHKEHTEHK